MASGDRSERADFGDSGGGRGLENKQVAKQKEGLDMPHNLWRSHVVTLLSSS